MLGVALFFVFSGGRRVSGSVGGVRRLWTDQPKLYNALLDSHVLYGH